MTNETLKAVVNALMAAIMCVDFALVPIGKGTPPAMQIEQHLARVQEIRARREAEEAAYTEWEPAEEDIVALSKMAWGEARGCGERGIEAVMWVALHRLDAGYADTVLGVVSSGQFYGYSPNHPVTDEIRAIAERVLTAHHNGDEPLVPPEYLWFSGNGKYNTFRDASGNRMVV